MELSPDVIAKNMLLGSTEEEIKAVAAAMDIWQKKHSVSLKEIKKDKKYNIAMTEVMIIVDKILYEGDSNVVD